MFNKNLRDLVACGLSKAILQNLDKKSGEKIMSLIECVSIDFSSQFPENYKECENLWENGV